MGKKITMAVKGCKGKEIQIRGKGVKDSRWYGSGKACCVVKAWLKTVKEIIPGMWGGEGDEI